MKLTMLMVAFDAILLTLVFAIILQLFVNTKDKYNQQLIQMVNLQNYEKLREKDHSLEEIRKDKETFRCIATTAIRNLELSCGRHVCDDLKYETNISVLGQRLERARSFFNNKIS